MTRRLPAADARRHATVLAVGAALATVPAGAGAGVLALSLPAVRAARTTSATVSDLVVAVCAVGAALLLAWLAITVVVAAVDEARSHVQHRRRAGTPSAVVPVLVRRLVALAVGVAIGSSAVAAGAAPRQVVPEAGWTATAPAVPGEAVVGGPVVGELVVGEPVVGDTVPTVAATESEVPDPGWNSAPSALVELPGGQREPVVPDTQPGTQHVVQRGDSLWALARERCGPGTQATDVARELHRLHGLNLDVIGDDPDLILPGQVLRLV